MVIRLIYQSHTSVKVRMCNRTEKDAYKEQQIKFTVFFSFHYVSPLSFYDYQGNENFWQLSYFGCS